MSKTSMPPSSPLDSMLALGSKSLDFFERYSKIGIDTAKQLADSQIQFGNAVVEFGAVQIKGLTDTAAPGDFLQRQKTAFDGLAATAQGYFEQVRGAVQGAQQAYGQLGQELAGDVAKAFKPAA